MLLMPPPGSRLLAWLPLTTMLLVALLLAACSSDPTPTPVPTATATPEPAFSGTPTGDAAKLLAGAVYRTLSDDWVRTAEADELMALAQDEGEVVWSGYDQYQGDAWCDGFAAEFGIACTARGIGARQIVTALVSERDAGQTMTDVVYLSMSQMAQYLDRDMAAQVDWASLGADPRRAWSAEGSGNAVGVTQSQYTHFVNTDYIDPADVPQTVFEWLDPKWEGLICAPDFLLRAGNGFLSLYYDRDEMVELHKELLETQDVIVTADCDPFAVSGERPLMYMGYGYPAELLGTGNIQGFWNAGMGVNMFSHSVPADAPHPNAGRLLAAWTTSKAASALSWDAIGQGWAAFGHGPEELVSGRFADLELVYESPVTFKGRGEGTAYFQEQVFGAGF
jgi:ABC-type Fe3+ transport system substrate-binding protein